jgi:hypothetical protein
VLRLAESGEVDAVGDCAAGMAVCAASAAGAAARAGGTVGAAADARARVISSQWQLRRWGRQNCGAGTDASQQHLGSVAQDAGAFGAAQTAALRDGNRAAAELWVAPDDSADAAAAHELVELWWGLMARAPSCAADQTLRHSLMALWRQVWTPVPAPAPARRGPSASGMLILAQEGGAPRDTPPAGPVVPFCCDRAAVANTADAREMRALNERLGCAGLAAALAQQREAATGGAGGGRVSGAGVAALRCCCAALCCAACVPACPVCR